MADRVVLLRNNTVCHTFLSNFTDYRQKHDEASLGVFFGRLAVKLERKALRILSFRSGTTRCAMLFFEVLPFTDKKTRRQLVCQDL